MLRLKRLAAGRYLFRDRRTGAVYYVDRGKHGWVLFCGAEEICERETLADIRREILTHVRRMRGRHGA
jgi:hypothetical protein